MNVLEFANSRLWERQMETEAGGQSSYNPLARLTSSLIQPDTTSPAGQSTTSPASTPTSAPNPPTPHPCPACEGILYYSFDPSGRPKKCMSCSPPQRLGYEQWIIAVDEGGEWICVPHWVCVRRHFLMGLVEKGELSLSSPPRRMDADDFALACGGWHVSPKKAEWGRSWKDKSSLLRWCRTIDADITSGECETSWVKFSAESSGGTQVVGSSNDSKAVHADSVAARVSVGGKQNQNASGSAGSGKASGVGKSGNGKSGKGKSSGPSLPAGPSLFGDAELMGDEHL